MVYKHRTKSGKVRHYQSKSAYEKSMKGMFAQNSNKMKHRKTIPISSKDKRHAAQFVRRARRKKGRPISKRMKHGQGKLPTNNIRIRLKRFAKNKIVEPKFLYYSLLNKHGQGEFQPLAHGTQNRQVLRKSDIAKIQLAVDSGEVGTLNYSLDELADIIVDAKDSQPDDIILTRVHDTKTVGKPYFVDNNRMTHSNKKQWDKRWENIKFSEEHLREIEEKEAKQKARQIQIEKLKAEKFQEPETKTKTKIPKPRGKTDKQAKERIYQTISEATEPISTKEIKEKVNITSRKTRYGLDQLQKQNRIQKIPNLYDVRKSLYTTSSRKPVVTTKKTE